MTKAYMVHAGDPQAWAELVFHSNPAGAKLRADNPGEYRFEELRARPLPEWDQYASSGIPQCVQRLEGWYQGGSEKQCIQCMLYVWEGVLVSYLCEECDMCGECGCACQVSDNWLLCKARAVWNWLGAP